MKKIYTRINNYKHNEYIILAIILISALILRIYKINNPVADWHSFRQADTASVTRLYIQNGINLLYPKYHDISRVQSGMFNPQGYRFVEFPIYNALNAITYKIFPRVTLEVWGRILSITSSLITAFFLYLIGKSLYDKWFGVYASAIFSYIPFNIYFSRVILPEPMAVMLGVVGLYFFILYSKSRTNRYLLIFSVLFALGLLVKPYIIFFGVVPLLWTLNEFKSEYKKKKWILFSLLIIFLPIILWRGWMSQFPEGIPFWKWTFNGDGIRFHPAFFRWIFDERLGYLILGVWGVVPFFFGLVNLKRKDWFILYLLLGNLAYVVIIATANVRHDYYQTITIPAIALTLALGIKKMFLYQGISRWKVFGIIIIILGFSFLEGWSQVREFYKIDHPEIIAAGSAVDRLTPKEALVIAAYNGDTAFLYQTKRRGWPVVELPINELIQEGAEYYTSVNLSDSQTQEFMKEFRIMEKTDSYVVMDLRMKQ